MRRRGPISWLNERFSRGSIRSTIFASFTVSAVVAILLTGATLFARFSAQMDATIEEENQILVDQVNQSLSTYLRDVIRLSDSISYNVIKNTNINSGSFDERMRMLYNTYSDYMENIALFDSAGRLIATAPPARLRDGADVRERDWFRRAMARTENIHFGGPAVRRDVHRIPRRPARLRDRSRRGLHRLEDGGGGEPARLSTGEQPGHLVRYRDFLRLFCPAHLNEFLPGQADY